MKIGIVGSEGKKFTTLGEANARQAIVDILSGKHGVVDSVVSGHCHLGGIDIFAEEEADRLGIQKEIYPPRVHSWDQGYKPRNLQIARASDICYCITVDILPPDFKGMRFKECYHCKRYGRSGTDHVKSGGCWTVIEAIKLDKRGEWITVTNV